MAPVGVPGPADVIRQLGCIPPPAAAGTGLCRVSNEPDIRQERGELSAHVCEHLEGLQKHISGSA